MSAARVGDGVWGAMLALALLPWLNPFALGPSAAAIPLLFSWLCLGLGLLLAGPQMRSVPWAKLAAWSWLIAALVSVFIAAIQYLGWAAPFEPWINQTRVGVAYANLRQPNQLASLCSLGLCALLWLAVERGWGRQRVGATSMVAALLGAGVAMSGSRTGLLQLLMLSALTWYWGRRSVGHWQLGLRLLLAAGLGYLAAMLFMPLAIGLGLGSAGIWGRLQGPGDGCQSRLILWRNVLELALQRPWTGWGWGELDYAHFMHHYSGARFCDIVDNAHNLPLHLAVELGFPLAVAGCGAVLWALWRGRPWSDPDPQRHMAWAGLAVIGLHSLLEYPLWYGPFQMATLLCAAVLMFERKEAFAQTSHPQAAPVFIAFFAGILVALSAFAFVDYWRASQLYRPAAARASFYQTDTLAKLRDVVVFQNQVRFAELTLTPVTPGNAAAMRTLALEMLHFSPEARVVRKLVEASETLGLQQEAEAYRARFRVAFPDEPNPP